MVGLRPTRRERDGRAVSGRRTESEDRSTDRPPSAGPALEDREVALGVEPVVPLLVEDDRAGTRAPGSCAAAASPGASTGSVSPASDSSVRPSTTARTVAIRSRRRASTSSSDGRTSRSRGTPGRVGHLVPRQVERVPRRRVAEDRPAHPRVGGEDQVAQRLDERPLAVDRLVQQVGSAAGGPARRCRPTAARRRPRPRGTRPGRSGASGPVGVAPVELGLDERADVDAVDGARSRISPVMSTSHQLDAAQGDAVQVDAAEPAPLRSTSWSGRRSGRRARTGNRADLRRRNRPCRNASVGY